MHPVGRTLPRVAASIPGPAAVRTPAEFVAQLRTLKAWSGLSFRELERRARVDGRQLPISTMATALNRASLPHPDMLAALVAACGGDDEDVALWVEARRRLAVEEQGAPLPDPPHHRQRRRSPEPAAVLPARPLARRAGYRSRRGAAGGPLVPCLLPPEPLLFVGRTEELSAARRLLTGTGPATLLITGPAGVGKTSLAVRIGHSRAAAFPDGQLYTDLQGFDGEPATPLAVLGAFLRALGVRGGSVPSDLTSRIHLYRSLLAHRRVLVILDNAADYRHVRDLLPNGRCCAAIVTSRTTLAGLDGERTPLDILTGQQAIAMLRYLVGDRRVDAEPEEAQSIVDACCRLPLAVWVAGARLAARPHWSLSRMVLALADEHNRLDELTVGDLAVRGSLTLTYRAMRPEARRALRLLSLLPGSSFAAWALAALLGTCLADAERLLDELVEVHLVTVSGIDAAGVHHRMHDLVRVFGRERAFTEDAAADRGTALGRVLSASMHLADVATNAVGVDFHGIGQGHLAPWRLTDDEVEVLLDEPMSWLAREHRFLVAVAEQGLDTGQLVLAACLATALTTFFQLEGHFDEWERLQSKALAALGGSDPGSASKLHRCLGELTTILDRYPEALHHFEQALRLSAPDDPGYTASAMAGLAYVHRLLGQHDLAVRHFQRAADLARSAGNVNCLVYATNGIGVAELERGRPAIARRLFAECLAVSREHGYRPGEAQALRCLGQDHRARGELDAAAECFQRAAAISNELGDRLTATHAICWLGDVWTRQGRHREGRRLLAESLWSYRAFGNLWGEAAALYGLAEAQLAMGRRAHARRRAEAAVALWRKVGASHWLAIASRTLAAGASGVAADPAAAGDADQRGPAPLE